MATKKVTTEQFVQLAWAPWESDQKGGWSFEQMKAAAAMHTARQTQLTAERLARCAIALESILSRLDILGREGIHDVVKEFAREARAKKKRRLARRRRARKLKLVSGGTP